MENKLSPKEELTKTQQMIQLTNEKLTKIPNLFTGTTSPSKILIIDLSNNMIREITPEFYKSFPNLQSLLMQNNQLIRIDCSISSLSSLNILKLDCNRIRSLPSTIGKLKNLEVLSVASNFLKTVPLEIGLLGKTLKILNISANQITYLPIEIGHLNNLTEFYINKNQLLSIPSSIGQIKTLKKFGLEWSSYVPEAFQKFDFIEIKLFRHFIGKQVKLNKQNCTFNNFIKEFTGKDLCDKCSNFQETREFIHIASSNNHLGILEELIKLNLNLNSADKNLHTPLFLAIRNEDIEAAKMLMAAGAEVNYVGYGIRSCLHVAVENLNYVIVKELINKGANVNIVETETLNVPLHILMKKFHRSPHKAQLIAEALMKAGANPNIRNREGWAPIHFAVKKKGTDAIKWINQYNLMAEQLKLKKYDICYESGKGSFTPLHIAGYNGNFEVVHELVENGADLFAKANNERTPKQSSRGSPVVYKYLTQAENIIIKNSNSARHFCNSPSRSPLSKFSPTHQKLQSETLAIKIFQCDGENIPPRKRSAVDVFSTEIQELEHTSFAGNTAHSDPQNINQDVEYLKKKILNNDIAIYERYNAWQSVLLSKDKKITKKHVNEILSELLSINNVGFQIDIIRSSNLMTWRSSLKILNELNDKTTNALLKDEIKEAIENFKVEYENKQKKTVNCVLIKGILPNFSKEQMTN